MKIIDDETYKRWQKLYVENSNEKEQVQIVLKNILSSITTPYKFLDIGPGDGALTFYVNKFFKELTVVEPNILLKSIFEKEGNFINANFEEVDFNNKKFDFILCSHVFWLVDEKDQVKFLEKMYSCLNINGKFAVIMLSPVGQSHDFHKKFFLNYKTTTHDILKKLHILGLKTEVYPVISNFSTNNFDDFFNICKLFTAQSWLHPKNISNQTISDKIGDLEAFTNKRFQEMASHIEQSYKLQSS